MCTAGEPGDRRAYLGDGVPSASSSARSIASVSAESSGRLRAGSAATSGGLSKLRAAAIAALASDIGACLATVGGVGSARAGENGEALSSNSGESANGDSEPGVGRVTRLASIAGSGASRFGPLRDSGIGAGGGVARRGSDLVSGLVSGLGSGLVSCLVSGRTSDLGSDSVSNLRSIGGPLRSAGIAAGLTSPVCRAGLGSSTAGFAGSPPS